MNAAPFSLLPEWAPQSGVMLTWPHAETDWAPLLDEVVDCYLRIAAAIVEYEPLLIVTPEPDAVRRQLSAALSPAEMSRVRLFECPTDDTWARDHGFLTLGGPRPALLDFRFNGWGGKFAAERDNAVNRRLFDAGMVRGEYRDHLDFELEGGSIETDGCGTLLTTEECLLNANRNGGLTRAEAEERLAQMLGVSRFLWLGNGYLSGDDTDSHVDTLARFASVDTILYSAAPAGDEHHSALSAMARELQAFRTADGRPYRLLPLPIPEPIVDECGERLPATYANFLILNGAVLVPVYGQPRCDEAALATVALAFADRAVKGVDCRALIRQHGSLHCATMQLPAGVLPPCD